MKFRKINTILIVLGLLIMFNVKIDNVNAAPVGTTGQPGGEGTGNTCSGGKLCYNTSTGIRITLVNESGKRCHKDGSNLCSSTGDASKSIDYWISSNSEIFSKACYSYNTKRTKSEFIENMSTSGIVNCSDTAAYGTIYRIQDLGFPIAPTVADDGNNNKEWLRYDSTNWKYIYPTEVDRNPTNIGNIVNYFQCSQILENDSFVAKEFGSNNELKNCKNGNGKTIRELKGDTIINNILQLAYNDSNLDIKNNTNETIYLQVEQLIAFRQKPGAFNPLAPTVEFRGTVAEVAYMYNYYKDSNVDYSKYRFALFGSGSNQRYENNSIEQITGGSSAVTTNVMNGFYANKILATGMSKVVDSSFEHASDFFGITDEWNVGAIKDKLKKYYQDDTANIFSIYLNPALSGSCESEAKNYFGTTTKPSIDGLKEYLHNKYITDLDSYTGPGVSDINVADAKIRGILYDDELNYCSNITCGKLLTAIPNNKKNKESLKKLHDAFKSYDYIDPDFLDEMGIEYNSPLVSCKKAPECPVNSSTFHCNTEGSDESSTGNRLTLKDNDDTQNCLSQGIAYNGYTENNTFHKEAVQSSYDSEYGTPGDPGYCSEKVTFDFPGNASATAGKLLKWGKIEDDQEFREFGTMTVHRTCYLSESKKKWDADKKVTITSNWADVKGSGFITANNYGNIADEKDARINPIIELNYVQAVPEKYRDGEHQVNNYRVKENLKVYLSKFVMTDDQNVDNELNDVEYDINGNVIKISDDNINDGNNPRTTTLNKDSAEAKGIDMIKYVDMTATYKIVYDNNLYWYSDKSNQFALTTTNDEDAMAQNPSYVALGYGLPTSFLTPSTPIDKHYGYALNSSESGGKLSVSVSQIGTQNSTGGKYHFDKMITYALDDDDNDNNDKIVYSCGFDIKNELFGYECGDHGENCDNTCTNPPCDSPKGIDVVFRTVDLVSSEEDLTMAFPGRSGKGRQRGKNWAELDDEEVVDILNNNIYNNTPIYEINLNSSLIQNIRLANKNMRAKGNDPYSDMTLAQGNGSEGDGYQGYTYYQSKGDNKFAKCMEFFSFFTDSTKFRECMSSPSESESSSTTGPVASNFIKHLIEKGSLTGRCATQSDNSRRIENILSGCEG